jgi:hypothetical protein
MIKMLELTSQKIDPNLKELAERSEAGDERDDSDGSNFDEEEIDSDAEPTDMPTSFGKNKNLAMGMKFRPEDWTDSSEDEGEDEEEGEEEMRGAGGEKKRTVMLKDDKMSEDDGNEDGNDGTDQGNDSSVGPMTIPKGGKGSYRELCKQDFRRAAWLAGRAASKTAAEKVSREESSPGGEKEVSAKPTKKNGMKRPRGKRGGKKNKKDGGGGRGGGRGGGGRGGGGRGGGGRGGGSAGKRQRT